MKKSRGRQGQNLIIQNYSREIFRNTWDHLEHLGFEGMYVYAVQAYRWSVQAASVS